MKVIALNGDKKVSDLQKEFNEAFPFLKLEFFQHRHAINKGSARKDIFNADLELKLLQKKPVTGKIVLKETMKVSELEELFQNTFGLSVQVFRKSGKSWLETTVTDSWSLKQQNDEGMELSSMIR